jgi:putative ABC transport system permease protein
LTAIGWTSDYAAQGRAAGDFGTEATHRRVSPAYFATMRVPIVSGRPFTTDDMRTAPRVAIINDVVAAKYFHGQDPIGQRIAFDRVPDSNSVWRTIVGVVASEHQTAPGVPAQAEIFEAFAQSRQITMSLLLRTNRDPMSYAPAIRRLIAEMDPTLAVGSIQTMNGVAAASLGRERFEMTLFGAFAILGLTLAIVGVYGVLAQVARRRRREIGIRVALGAEVSQVRWMVVRHGLRLSLTGAVIGVLAALWATRTLQGLLYGVPATDPLTFAFVAALLVATSLLAAWIPATRAGAVDPVVALRE